jgi:hypothetical protein
MKKTIVMVAVAAALMADTAEGQRRGGGGLEEWFGRDGEGGPFYPELGIRGSYDFERRDFGVGGQLLIPLTRRLAFVPSGDYFLGDEEDTWQGNADVTVSLRVLRAGLGLAVVDPDQEGVGDSDDPELGLNLFAGVQSPLRRSAWLRPYAEARWTFLEDDTPFRLAAGVNLRIRGIPGG